MRLTIVIILLFGITFTWVSADDCNPASGEAIRFGAVFPQDFLLLDNSNSAYNAVLAMSESYNQCNYGSQAVEWQLEVASNYDDAVQAMERFSENNIPLVIGSGIDNVSEGLNDAATEYEIVFWDVTERPRQTPSDWTFTLRPDDTLLTKRTVEYIEADVVNTILDEPLRLALVVEDTPRAITMANAVRKELVSAIVVDENIKNSSDVAVKIRETDANLLLLITITTDATDLWFNMRQADANVDAWMFLGQEQLMISRRYVDDGDTTGVVIIGSQHFATASIEQAIPSVTYNLFLEQYRTFTDEEPDTEALSAAIGTYYLLFSVLPQVSPDITSGAIREVLQNTSDIDIFNMRDEHPLVVRQQQEDGYCLLMPVPFITCNEALQTFPTWRQRALNNQ